jgi:hypothetical protein
LTGFLAFGPILCLLAASIGQILPQLGLIRDRNISQLNLKTHQSGGIQPIDARLRTDLGGIMDFATVISGGRWFRQLFWFEKQRCLPQSGFC